MSKSPRKSPEIIRPAARPRRGMARQPGKGARSTACPIRKAAPTYLVRFTAPEFTSLCPVTGQPDFAHLVIDYVPGQWLWNRNR